MRKAAIFAATMLLCGLAAESAAAAGCQLVRYAQVPITGNLAQGVTLPVTVDGTKTRFLIDTGSFMSALSETITDAQGLSRHQWNNRAYAADSKKIDFYTEVPELDIVNMPVKNALLFVMTLNEKNESDKLGGILGRNFLKVFDLDFDFGGHMFNLFGQNECGKQVVYWSDRAGNVPFKTGHDHIIVDVILDGESFHGIIDTGSSHTLISAGEAKRRFGLQPGASDVKEIAGAKPNALVRYMHTFKTMTIGDITVNSPVVGLLPDDAAKGILAHYRNGHGPGVIDDPNMHEMIIGMDILSKMHVYISYRQGMLYVTPANTGHKAGNASADTSARWSDAQ